MSDSSPFTTYQRIRGCAEEPGGRHLEALAATVDYVHLYRGDRPALAASLDRIQRTAATILRLMDSD